MRCKQITLSKNKGQQYASVIGGKSMEGNHRNEYGRIRTEEETGRDKAIK